MGGALLVNSEPVMGLARCIIRRNHANFAGVGLRVATSMTVELRRCLIANALGGGAIAAIDNGNAWPAGYSDLGGNLAADPLLCADHVSPTPLSPCLPANRAGVDACGLIGALAGGCGN